MAKITIINQEQITEDVVQLLDNFLKEFSIPLSIRLLNTMANVKKPAEYLINYAMLTGRDYITLSDKIGSLEYKEIEAALNKIETKKKINQRLSIYFGNAGTGKTTTAIKEAKGDVVVMNESITPKELMFDFTFEDGKPSFTKSAFCKAMENGTTIVLDEINLAPFETLRFLQGVLDNKEEVTISGETIKIKKGFSVIGTMNETVLGTDYYLPEPLIDRCFEIKKFELSHKKLAQLAF